MSDQANVGDQAKTPLDHALDLFVFAPVGLALTARDELPRLVARGRTQVTGQMALAKMFGQFAVTQGQREAQKAAERLVEQATQHLAGRRPPRAATDRPADPSAGPAGNGSAAWGNGSQTGGAATAAASARGTLPPARTADLAIPGYDTLSASQVVQRLGGLASDELEAVRSYEASTRGRRTILSKVAQLQSGS